MGVTRDTDDIFFYGYIDDEYELSIAEDIEDERILANENRRKSQKRKSKVTNVRQHGGEETGNCGKMSTRQLRNYDRLKQLMNLIEKEDITELDYDLFEPNLSAFAELFMETEKMKIWNDFINTSEEEQQAIISQSSSQRHDNANNAATEDAAVCDNEVVLDGWEVVPDNRKVHPAFSAADCFKRISGNLRSILKKKNLPKDTLAQLEDEVTSFFTGWPTSVYVSQLLTRFERVLMHALCQYLDLSSQKLATQKGLSEEERLHTQILNKHPYFNPPPTKLVDYLAQRR